jgi:hypothetical protein
MQFQKQVGGKAWVRTEETFSKFKYEPDVYDLTHSQRKMRRYTS